jgi:hypothetical protein
MMSVAKAEELPVRNPALLTHGHPWALIGSYVLILGTLAARTSASACPAAAPTTNTPHAACIAAASNSERACTQSPKVVHAPAGFASTAQRGDLGVGGSGGQQQRRRQAAVRLLGELLLLNKRSPGPRPSDSSKACSETAVAAGGPKDIA